MCFRQTSSHHHQEGHHQYRRYNHALLLLTLYPYAYGGIYIYISVYHTATDTICNIVAYFIDYFDIMLA